MEDKLKIIPTTVTFRFLLTVAVTAAGSSFQFYSFAVLNTPQTIIQNWINDSFYRRNHVGLNDSSMTLFWSFLTSSICLGAFAGCLTTRSLAEYCGRKNALIANGLLSVFGGLCSGLAKGMSMGLSSSLAPMYLTEIAPVNLRGAAGTAHQIAVAFGDWFSLFLSLPQIFGNEKLWPLAVVFPALPAILLCVVLPFCPESPRFLLISLEDRQKSQKALEFFVGREHSGKEFDSMVKEAAGSMNPAEDASVNFREFLKRKELRMPLIISVLVMIAQQFTGAAAIFAFSTEMLTEANLSENSARFATLGVGICYFLFTLPSPYLIERSGRRMLSLFQLSGCLVALVFVTVFTALQQHLHYSWAPHANIAAFLMFMCVYGVGSPIPWMITSELFAQEYRSTAVGISTFVSWFGAFIISTLYLPFQKLVGVEYSFLPFILVLALSLVGMYFLLPETTNKTIDEIVNEFRERRRTLSRTFTRSHLPKILTHPELNTLLEEAETSNSGPNSRYGSIDQ